VCSSDLYVASSKARESAQSRVRRRGIFDVGLHTLYNTDDRFGFSDIEACSSLLILHSVIDVKLLD
jgi:hypothetical protein